MKTYSHTFNSQNSLLDFLTSIDITHVSSTLVHLHTYILDDQQLEDINRLVMSFFNNAQIINFNEVQFSNKDSSLYITTFKATVIRGLTLYQDLSFSTPQAFVKLITNKTKGVILYGNTSPSWLESIALTINANFSDIHISGGLTSTYELGQLRLNEQTVKNGVVGIILDSDVLQIHHFSYNNLIPVGQSHEITHADNNNIYSIDQIPAQRFYEKYLGRLMHDNVTHVGQLFPLLSLYEGRYLQKPIVSIDEAQIVVKTAVNIGDPLILGYDDLNASLRNYKQIINTLDTIPIESIHIFNESIISVHNRTDLSLTHLVHDITPSCLPTSGELIYENNTISINATSFSIITMSESDNAYKTINHTLLDNLIINHDQEILMNMIKRTSKELTALNHTLSSTVNKKVAELKEYYYQDYLTKLPNQNQLIENSHQGLVKHLALLDISSFININNFYGHHSGNIVLVELAHLIVDFVKTCNYKTYRVHSDIFAISSDRVEEHLHFRQFMQILQQKIQAHCFINDSHQIYILTTMAVTSFTPHIYENARVTLEYAKSKNIAFLNYDSNLHLEEIVKSNIHWTNKIRIAIQENRIQPFFQAIYNNKSGKIDHYEALMRMVDYNGDIIPPNAFLDIAKKANLYKPLTRIMISKTFNYFRHLPYNFSVNISAADITDKYNREFIYEQLRNFPEPNRVIFELVESEGIENYTYMIQFINAIKRYKAKVAIDDFGTGFSNFHYLFKLNVDIIKIDGSIIQQINNENSAKSVAEVIIDFAKKMNLITVAEFVSDKAIFESVKNLGIDYSQGYYISKPKKYIK